MKPIKPIEIFTKMFPNIAYSRHWPKGAGAVRIRPVNCEVDLIFTYYPNEKNWRLETLPLWELSRDGI